jgi:hemerythrin-like metal-binding protein
MALVKWSDELSVGVPSLDHQHKEMLLLLNGLHEGMMSGKDKIVLGDTLNRLISATVSHFKYEEALLTRAGYADQTAHRIEHADLMRQISGIRRQYELVGPGALNLPVMSFLKTWLMAHIHGADMRYRDCLVAQGIQ